MKFLRRIAYKIRSKKNLLFIYAGVQEDNAN
jgi:hypothetical protein